MKYFQLLHAIDVICYSLNTDDVIKNLFEILIFIFQSVDFVRSNMWMTGGFVGGFLLGLSS